MNGRREITCVSLGRSRTKSRSESSCWSRKVLTVWLLALTGGIAACSSPLPQTTPEFEKLQPLPTDVSPALALPDLPRVQCWPSDADCQVAGLDEQGFRDLEVFAETAKGNLAISRENENALRAAIAAHNALILASVYNERILLLREEQTRQLQSDYRVQIWTLRGWLALALLAGGLAL